MNHTYDEYESVGERATYQNAVLAEEAKRNRISSPRVTMIIPSSPVYIATPPPVMIPSTDTICSMPTDNFMAMLKSLSEAATQVEAKL